MCGLDIIKNFSEMHKLHRLVRVVYDLNPRPRLSSADVLTTIPSGRPRNNAAKIKALWLTGLPTNFSVFTGADWKACRPF